MDILQIVPLYRGTSGTMLRPQRSPQTSRLPVSNVRKRPTFAHQSIYLDSRRHAAANGISSFETQRDQFF
jgi:hypothetical protein